MCDHMVWRRRCRFVTIWPLPWRILEGCGVNRGNRPEKAIAEAKRYAAAIGFRVASVEASWVSFDFMAVRDGCITLVRVRRVRYRKFATEEIDYTCGKEITLLRQLPVGESVVRELWVRGPDRYWFRYRILPDRIDLLGGERDVTFLCTTRQQIPAER